MKTRRWLLALTAVALLAAPLFALENEASRRDQLKRLRGAIRAYAALYPDKPATKLSQLIDENFLEGPGALMRPGATAMPTRAEIDTRADYTLEPLAGASDLVVRERAPLAGETDVFAIFPDGSIRALTAPAAGSPGAAGVPAPVHPPSAATPPPIYSPPLPTSVTPPPEVAAASSPPPDAAARTAVPSPPASQPVAPAAVDAPKASANALPPGITVRGNIPPEMLAALVQMLKDQGGRAPVQPTEAAPPRLELEPAPKSSATIPLQPSAERRASASDAAAVALQMLAQFGQANAARQQKAAQDEAAILAANNALAENPQALFKMYPGPDMSALQRATAPPAQPVTNSAPSIPTGAVNPAYGGSPSVRAPIAAGQWRVTHQLVSGLPWVSATWTKQQTDDARAAAQASHDDRRIADSYRDAGGWGRTNEPSGGYYQAFEMALYTLQDKLKLGKVPEVAFALNNIALAATEKDITGAAESYFSEAREIWEQLTNAGRTPNEDYAVMLHNYAALKKKLGDASAAAQLESQAASLLGQNVTAAPAAANSGPLPGMNSVSSAPAPAAGKWQVTHQLVVDLPWPSAKWTEQEIRAQVKDAESTPDQRLVNALNDLAGWYRGQGRYQDAYDTYYRVKDIQVRRGLEHHADLALVLNDMGVIQTETKGYRDAIGAFRTALEQWDKYGTTPLPTEDYAVTLHNYACACRLSGDARTAADFEAKAAQVMETRRQALGL